MFHRIFSDIFLNVFLIFSFYLFLLLLDWIVQAVLIIFVLSCTGLIDFSLPLHFTGSDFQNEVWGILSAIPYGQTTTYGEIAKQLAQRREVPRMSAQAVGGAVGKNEISIIVPCHRVVGTNGSLTGYAGGIRRKIALLKMEGAWKENYYVPKKSTALRWGVLSTLRL